MQGFFFFSCEKSQFIKAVPINLNFKNFKCRPNKACPPCKNVWAFPHDTVSWLTYSRHFVRWREEHCVCKGSLVPGWKQVSKEMWSKGAGTRWISSSTQCLVKYQAHHRHKINGPWMHKQMKMPSMFTSTLDVTFFLMIIIFSFNVIICFHKKIKQNTSMKKNLIPCPIIPNIQDQSRKSWAIVNIMRMVCTTVM